MTLCCVSLLSGGLPDNIKDLVLLKKRKNNFLAVFLK